MATYEIDEVHRGPCLCGKGKLVISRESPNHAFGRVRFFGGFECKVCDSIYETRILDTQCGGHAVRRADLDVYWKGVSEKAAKRTELVNRWCKPLIDEVLRDCRIAGNTREIWHRAMSHFVDMPPLDEFKKSVKSAGSFRAWLDNAITPEKAPFFARRLWPEEKSARLEKDLEELKQLHTDLREPA